MTFWDFIDRHLERIDFKHVIGIVVTCWILWIFTEVILATMHDNPDKYIAQIITALTGVLTMVLGFWFIASNKNKGATDGGDTTTIISKGDTTVTQDT